MSIIKKILNYIITLITMPTTSKHLPAARHTAFFKKRIKVAALSNLVTFKENVGQKLQLNITYLIAAFIIISTQNFHASTNDQFTIMIDPAGDAKHTGRLIQDTLERGISLQCAEQLKATLIQKFKNVRVILTRVPGETIQPLQFANRLGVDLYVSLYFYHEPENPAHVTLYHYLENPVVDLWHKPISLSLYQVNQAHLLNVKTTQIWGKIMLEVLQDKKCSKFFRPRGLFGIPFTPLVGIKAPAIAVEVGLKSKQDWQYIIDPLVVAIEMIMQ
jgi:N-acetylmuramoyl-L-alanine amidase